MAERYDCTNGNARYCYGCYTMKKAEFGDWVKHEDYYALAARLAEAKGLLEEIGDEWPAVKRTTVERAYAFIERPTDSASPALDLNAPFDAPIRAQQARDAATYAEGLQRQREYMASDEFKRLVRAAYIQGATDVHENRQEDRCPDFNEAADDYAATVTVSAGQESKP